MKTTKLIILAALSVMAASCNKTFTEPEKVANEEEVTYLTFDVDAEVTKATSTYNETSERETALLKNFQVVAYDVDNQNVAGNVSSWFLVSNVNQQNKFTVPLKRGKKRLLFLCNQGLLKTQDAPNWSSRDQVITTTQESITANSLPLGYGFDDPYYNLIIQPGSNQSVNISLQHMCSRLVLKSITNEMPEGSGVSKIMGKFITLLNIPKGMKMNGVVQNTPYLQPMGNNYSSATLCAGSGGAGAHFFKTLSYSGQTIDTLQPAILYTYPGNNVHMLIGLDITMTNATEPTTYYYAVPMRNTDFNKSYDVHLKVKNLGSTTPEEPSVVYNSEFTVSVSDWSLADSITENM